MALASVAAGWVAAESTAPAPQPAAFDTVTASAREVIRDHQADSEWGADPPDAAIAERGEPVSATVLAGAGHALVAIGSDGRPAGAQLWFQHVRLEGDGAASTECVLRVGLDDDRSCPPVPTSLVDCATWSVPAEAARATLLAARAALFVRLYEKKYIRDPREELVDGEGVGGGVVGGISGGSTGNFVAVASVVEQGEQRIRVGEEWAGYPSSDNVGSFTRAVVSKRLIFDGFPRPKDAPASEVSPAVHAEFSRLFGTLPLDADFWWWVRERMVQMAGELGGPADLPRLEGYLKPRGKGRGESRTQANALEALAQRTGRDTRCDGSRRLDDAAAAAARLRHP